MRRMPSKKSSRSERAPSAVKLTPSHIALLATLPGHTSCYRTAIVGGEALTAAHVKTLEAALPRHSRLQ